jgi:NAD(P)-dependent dehydrogenase (short-subunit alcohol dehydrogenase family)
MSTGTEPPPRSTKGRLGQPEEIARGVAFVAAGESAYIIRQIWSVSGGLDV